MSKSARIATPSSPANKSLLTPPVASSASPRNTPTPPPKWKPQKQAPPRSRRAGASVSLHYPHRIVKDLKQSHHCELLWDSHSRLSLFLFSHPIASSPNN